MDVRIRKLLSDLVERKTRTVITTLGLVIGLSGLGSVLVAQRILSHDLSANFTRTQPAHVVMDVAGLGPEMLPGLAGIPGLVGAERRPVIGARIEISPDRYLPLVLFVVDDFDDLRVARFYPQAEAWPPPSGELLIERDGRPLVTFMRRVQAAADQGRERRPHELPSDIVAPPAPWRVRLPGGVDLYTDIAGTVYDPGQAPSRMEQMVYGYISRQTAEAWMPEGFRDRLLLRTDATPEQVERIRMVAEQVSERLRGVGVKINRTRFPDADAHPHQFQMNSILTLLMGLGGAAFILSAVLVINLVVSLLTNQIRQIGALKAMGASTVQVSLLYLAGLGLLGLGATLFALPLSLVGGFGLSRVMAAMLNFEVLTRSLPAGFLALGVVAGVAYPMLAGLGAVLRWCRVPVRDALENHGVTGSEVRGSPIDALPLPLPLAMRLGLRNALRKPGRFVLGVLSLAVGAAVFMAAMNLRASLLYTADLEEASKRHDLGVSFEQRVERSRISWIDQFPQVDSVELWSVDGVELAVGDGSVAVPLIAVPEDNQAFVPNLQAGRWIGADVPTGVVASHRLMDRHPSLTLGERLTLDLGGHDLDVQIIGVIRLFGPAALYLPASSYHEVTGHKADTGNVALVTLKEDGYGEEARFAAVLDRHFDLAEIPVSTVQISKLASRVIRNHLVVIEVMLAVVAGVMLVVATLGLASGIGTSVVERTREIGVMRAIGATPGGILRILLTESVCMALVAWGLAVVLATPASRTLSAWFGAGIVEYPFDDAISALGILGSAVVVVVLAGLATWGPVRLATGQPVREAVGYE